MSLRLHAAAFIVGGVLLATAERSAEADERPAEHGMYVEAGGAAVLYSLNYEYRIIPELGMRAGMSVVPLCLFGSCTTVAVVPVSMHGIVGDGDHHLECGAGFTLITLRDDDARFAFAELGYLYEKPSGGFLFRATFTPLFRLKKLSDVLPWAGVSFGYGW
jgi:hypothetical protein